MCPGPLSDQSEGMDTRETLERRLALAHARCRSQPSFSPDWDAAMSDVDEVTARLVRLDEPGRTAGHRALVQPVTSRA
jgi:hypothetical protein